MYRNIHDFFFFLHICKWSHRIWNASTCFSVDLLKVLHCTSRSNQWKVTVVWERLLFHGEQTDLQESRGACWIPASGWFLQQQQHAGFNRVTSLLMCLHCLVTTSSPSHKTASVQRRGEKCSPRLKCCGGAEWKSHEIVSWFWALQTQLRLFFNFNLSLHLISFVILMALEMMQTWL